eukprot:PITA_34476
MLYEQDLPRFLWAEACNMAVCIQNRTPHRALGKKTPKGVFTGKKPEVSHFRIFGSIAYCHMPDERCTKLDHTAENGFLVGYSEILKAYRIYIPSSRKIVVTKPSNIQEVAQHQLWVDAMVEVYSSIMTNDVWEVVPRPEDRSIVGSRWIYKIKYVANGNAKKYKVRFMPKGYA